MSDATSSDPTQVLSGVLSDSAGVLFGLEAEFRVVAVGRAGPEAVQVVIEQVVVEGPCPTCGVVSSAVKDRPLIQLKDLPASGQTVELWWRKRRLLCGEALCLRRSFTQTATAVRPRARITERLRDKVASAIATSNRAVSEVAAEYGVSWPTAHKALVVAAARWLPEPEPTAVLGIDETRFRSVRWILEGLTWRRSDPWLTSFVDCTPGHPGPLIGLAPGRTGGCVRDWLGEQSDAFRRRIEIVVIDPSAPLRIRDPGRAARGEDRGRQVAPGRVGEHHGHRGPTAGHPGLTRPPWHGRRTDLGQPAAAADRCRAPQCQAMETARPDARPL